MSNASIKESVVVFVSLFAILSIIVVIRKTKEPKCSVPECVDKRAANSYFCELHTSYRNKASSYGSTTYDSSKYGSSTYGSEGTNSITKSSTGSTFNSFGSKSNTTNSFSYNNGIKDNTTSKSTTKKKDAFDSYDDGYNDIYDDGDYDYDRYDNDIDYADGVDDAIDELGEEW